MSILFIGPKVLTSFLKYILRNNIVSSWTTLTCLSLPTSYRQTQGKVRIPECVNKSILVVESDLFEVVISTYENLPYILYKLSMYYISEVQ